MLFLTVAAAAALDHSDYQGVLSAQVNAKGDVDYAAVQASGALDAYLTALQTAAEPSEQRVPQLASARERDAALRQLAVVRAELDAAKSQAKRGLFSSEDDPVLPMAAGGSLRVRW